VGDGVGLLGADTVAVDVGVGVASGSSESEDEPHPATTTPNSKVPITNGGSVLRVSMASPPCIELRDRREMWDKYYSTAISFGFVFVFRFESSMFRFG
jgi:hypothetical protein